MAKQYIDVLIDGIVYSLGGSETEGYVQQIATYLNGKIFQLKAQPGFLKMPEDYQSIMTYLNLADDYFKEKESAKALASDKESMEKETYRLKHEMVSTQMKLESLRNERTVSEEELETAKKAAKEAAEQAEAAKNEVQAQIERVKKEAQEQIERAIKGIKEELAEQVAYFKEHDQLIEAQRIAERTNFDIEMLRETGFCSGIENYSRHLAGLEPGQPPSTLIDFFGDDFLMIIDESHITVPQIGGMYAGDQSRKSTLVDFGFRLPSAKDNRPLEFGEFEQKIDQMLFVSATPGRSSDQQVY